MPIDLHPEDAASPGPTVGQMLGRGARRRCPRCGAGKLFRTWWSIADRCPRCGIRFVREEGYFTGVYLVNFTVVLALLFVLIMGATVYLSGNPNASLVPFLVSGVVLAVVVPLVFYPFARTIWAALDLAMTPMELEEILDAVEADGAEGASEDDTDAHHGDDEGGGGDDAGRQDDGDDGEDPDPDPG